MSVNTEDRITPDHQAVWAVLNDKGELVSYHNVPRLFLTEKRALNCIANFYKRASWKPVQVQVVIKSA